MLKFVLAFLLIAVAVAQPTGTDDFLDLNRDCEDYKKVHGKSYDEKEDEERMKLFLKTKLYVNEHNARYSRGEETSKAEINGYADMTLEELKKYQALGIRA